MNWPSTWSPLRILIFILLRCGTTRPIVVVAMEETPSPRLIVAASHTALSGDLGVLIIELPAAYRTTTSRTAEAEDVDIDLEEEDEDYSIENEQIPLQDPFVLRVLHLDGFTSELVGEVPVDVPNVAGVNVSLMIPCGFFSRGGTYSLQLQHKSSPVPNRFTETASLHDAQMRTTLDVRWPTPSLALEPQHFDTYPSQPVLATLEYTGISCTPSMGVPVPLYTVQLIYCGTSVLSCDPRNRSHVQMLYTEEVKGFPAQRVITLRCEFFGLAGHYALRLKPSDANPSAPTTSAYIKVEWSDLFVFNVHARSIYPCDGGGSLGGGVAVLFEYPACRLAGDRVRVYGRLRADVDSLAPPSSLHYVAELKAPTGVHTLTFDCDLFTERYIEYCFVYISQAYNGAMSEVRVDCIPTFPLEEGDAGGWGQWSQWTPCSSSCVGGTRTRHRFCDTPPPRYGAKFCQGERVETEACGGSTQLDLRGTWSPGDWECRHGEGLAADRPEVTAEVGTKCRCGCSLNIEREEHRKILAASSHVCPGHSFWLIQTNPSHVVKLHLDQARFPCQGQYVRIRDGDSIIDELLTDVSSSKSDLSMLQIVSTGPRMLLEFFSEEKAMDHPVDHETGEVCLAGFLAHVAITPKPATENGTTTSLPSVYLSPKVMAAAGRWSLWVTPAHLAAASLLILMFLVSVFLALQYVFKYRKYQVAEDLDSLTDNSGCSGSMQGLARRARAMSSSTLISEVVSLVRLPRRGSARHARLDETSADIEEGYESTETQPDSGEDEAEEEEEEDEEDEEEEDEEEQENRGTLRPREEQSGSQRTIAAGGSLLNIPTRRSSASSSSATITPAASATPAAPVPQPHEHPAGVVPAVVPTTGHAEVKYARPVKLRTFGPVSPVSEEAASTSEDGRQFSATSASTSLNNVRVVPHPKRTSNLLRIKSFSPASSSSNSTLRRCSGKESKDRRNRERLLQGPGSEFSLANQDLDLELDYYDYNVVNAGAAPGSYLGMDPAFLVWIPPLTEDEADVAEMQQEEEEPHYDEIPCERSGRLDTDGTVFTPLQYRKVKEAQQGDSSENDQEDAIKPKKLDPGECRLHDEIIMEYKARLGEGLLPIHRILEESRVRVSEDSLSSTSDVIPNRLETKGKSTARGRLSKKTKKFNRCKHKKTNPGSESSTQSSDAQETNPKRSSKPPVSESSVPRPRKLLRDPDRDYCEVNISCRNVPRTPNLGRKSADIAAFIVNNQEDKKVIDNAVNIPLAEFSRNRRESPVKVHGRGSVNRKNASLQALDYEAAIEEAKESFYDIIAKDDDAIKFADDDDEYIDNKVVA